MNKYKLIDEKNNYSPNLNDINESARRQFYEGNVFLEMADDIVKKYSNIDNRDLLYDISNAAAATLAFACESFLKALYIFENNTITNNINELWENLKKPEKIDASRNKKLVKGHDLDILIDNLSLDTKTLLETRLLTINPENTEKHCEITIYDILLKNNKIKKLNLLNENKYYSSLEHHKRTFEKSRYGGELYHKVNLEFLYHLTIQIYAVAQYKICPTEQQKNFKRFENIKELPDELITLFHFENGHVNENLIKIISTNPEKKEEFIKIVKNKTILEMLTRHTRIQLYALLKHFEYEELELIVNYLISYNDIYNERKKEFDKQTNISGTIYQNKLDELNEIDNISIMTFFLICCTAKKDYKINITTDSIIELTKIYQNNKNQNIEENISKLAKKIKG